MLRQTLGFRDKNGNPINHDISISYSDFIWAGISRGAIRKTVEEAVAGRFICCSQKGIATSNGQAAQTARYTLNWSTAGEYVTDPKQFTGFYAGDGCRSPIPNAFFDYIAPRETQAVVKVVGTVLRYTVGYANQFGRCDQAPLSYSFIQRYTNLANRTILAKAIRHSLDAGYIRCVQKGCFDPDGGKRHASIYAVRWHGEATSSQTGSKRIPVVADRFKKDTSIGTVRIPADRFKKDTCIEKTEKKETTKQQVRSEEIASAVAVDNSESYSLLLAENFDGQTAHRLSKLRSPKEIRKQIEWIDHRNPSQNRLGMLIRSIEENWLPPASVKDQNQREQRRQRQEQRDAEQAAMETAAANNKHKRLEYHKTLLSLWCKKTLKERQRHHQKAIKQANSDFDRRRLLQHTDLDHPPSATLYAMASNVEIPIAKSCA